VLIKKCRSIW